MSPAAVCVIPARFEASRFPGKLAADLGGRPVLAHVVANARGATRATRTVVATDDDRLAAIAGAAGAEVFESRRSHDTGSDRVAEACEALGLDGPIVNVQGDEPFLDSDAIDACVHALSADPDAHIATLATPCPRDTAASDAVVTVAVAENGRALYFSRSIVPWSGGEEDVLRHIGIYAYRAGALPAFTRLPRGRLERTERLEQLRALEAGWRIAVGMGPAHTIGIDTPADLARANELWKKGPPAGEKKGRTWRALSL